MYAYPDMQLPPKYVWKATKIHYLIHHQYRKSHISNVLPIRQRGCNCCWLISKFSIFSFKRLLVLDHSTFGIFFFFSFSFVLYGFLEWEKKKRSIVYKAIIFNLIWFFHFKARTVFLFLFIYHEILFGCNKIKVYLLWDLLLKTKSE